MTARFFPCARTPDQNTSGVFGVHIPLPGDCTPQQAVALSTTKSCAMAEYTSLMSYSLAKDNDELEPFEAGGKSSHLSRRFNVKNCTTLGWLAILMAITTISAAAALHIGILSTTSRLQSMRSPNDIISTLEMAQPDTNLHNGRAIMRQKGLTSESS